MNIEERFKRDVELINKYFDNVSQEQLNKDLECCGINYIGKELFGKVTFKIDTVYNFINLYNSQLVSNYNKYDINKEEFKRCKIMNQNQILAA